MFFFVIFLVLCGRGDVCVLKKYSQTIVVYNGHITICRRKYLIDLLLVGGGYCYKHIRHKSFVCPYLF